MNPRLEKLLAEWDSNKAELDAVLARSKDNGALDEADKNTYDSLMARAAELKPEIEKLRADEDLLRSVAAGNRIVTATPAETEAVAETKVRSGDHWEASEYLFHMVRSQHFQDSTSAQKLRTFATQLSDDSPGLLPFSIVGDIIKFVDANRYVINSLRRFPVPPGDQFKRRVKVSGADVQVQAVENTEIASGFPTVTYVDVPHSTYAGGVRVTLQASTFTNPNAVQEVLEDIAEVYAIKTDTDVCAALKTAATETLTLSSGATPEEVIEAIYMAADEVYANSKTQADTIWVSPSVRTFLATLVGTDGHPIFPIINPNNRMGEGFGATSWQMNICGLPVVVDPNFSGGTFIVGNSRWGEVYESRYPMLQAWNPSFLTQDFAMSGELGTYFRPEGFVKLTDNAATPVWG